MLHLGHIFSEISNDLLDCFPEPFLPGVYQVQSVFPGLVRLLEALISCIAFQLQLSALHFASSIISSELVKDLRGESGTKFGSHHLVFSFLRNPVSSSAFWSLSILSVRSSTFSSFPQQGGWAEMAILQVLEADIAINIIF